MAPVREALPYKAMLDLDAQQQQDDADADTEPTAHDRKRGCKRKRAPATADESDEDGVAEECGTATLTVRDIQFEDFGEFESSFALYLF